MCGIFGFIRSNPASQPQANFMADGFVAGQLRGPHGTGVMVVAPDHGVVGYTEPIVGADFVRHDGALKVLSTINGSLASVGHNRFTTSGQNIAEHCHPFQWGDIMGVHNGSIPSWVLQKFDPKASHPVDSSRLYAAISRSKNPIEVLEEIAEGAYALVWYDSKTRTIHMARNNERPLHIIQSAFGVYFASERDMVVWIAGRNNLFSAGDSVALLNPHTLYSFPLEDMANTTAVSYVPKVRDYSWKGSMGAATYDAMGRYTGYKDEGWYGLQYQRKPAEPSLVPFNTYFTLTQVESNHPYLAKTIRLVRQNILMNQNAVMPMLNVVLMEKCHNMEGTQGMAGFVAAPEKAEIQYETPVFIKLTYAGYMDYFAKMLPKAHGEQSEYPVVRCVIDKFQVTAAGELITMVRPMDKSPSIKRFTAITTVQANMAVDRVVNSELMSMSEDDIMGVWKTTIPLIAQAH